jgi:cytochrome c-type biogenesis protein
VIDVPFAYAFTVGMVATVNPCGFPVLPAWLSYYIGVDTDGAGAARHVPRALVSATAVSVGFLTVFAVLGIPIHAGRSWIYRWAPWLTILIGAALVVLGIAMLRGWRLRVALPHVARPGRSLASMVLFGVSYAVASLGCSLPLFLTVVANRPNAASGALAFVAYGLGMSVVLMVLALALALARGTLVGRLRAAVPYVERVAAVLLVTVGAYLIWYWADNLRRDERTVVGDSPLRVVDSWSAWAATELAERGAGFGLALVAAVAAVAGWALLRRGPSARSRKRSLTGRA